MVLLICIVFNFKFYIQRSDVKNYFNMNIEISAEQQPSQGKRQKVPPPTAYTNKNTYSIIFLLISTDFNLFSSEAFSTSYISVNSGSSCNATFQFRVALRISSNL